MSRERVTATSAATSYVYYCAHCQEFWRPDWMRRRGIRTCPLCEGSLIPRISKRVATDAGLTERRAAS